MRFLHTADLHIGKRVRGFSLLEEQKYALAQVARIARDEAVDAVLMAGDVFDKGVPPVEALGVFEDFLQQLVDAGIPVLVIAGNHDSADRLAFGARFMGAEHVHIAQAFSAEPQYVDVVARGTGDGEQGRGAATSEGAAADGSARSRSAVGGEGAPDDGTRSQNSLGTADGKGPNASATAGTEVGGIPQVVRVHLLPFVRPVHVRQAFPDRAEEIETYTDALHTAVENQPLLEGAANVLVAHQFVVDGGQGPETCDSETVSVGGLDSVEASVFDAFDYVALGHIHGHQRIRRDTVRYSGSLYPYSFSETGHPKYVSIVDVEGPGRVQVREVPLEEKRTLREVRGSYEELKAAAPTDLHADDYLHVTLTDDALMNAMEKVRALYPNVMQLDFERSQAADEGTANAQTDARVARKADPMDLLSSYFEAQAGTALTDEQRAAAQEVVCECVEGADAEGAGSPVRSAALEGGRA